MPNCVFAPKGPVEDMPGKTWMVCEKCGRKIRSRYTDPKLVHAMCNYREPKPCRCACHNRPAV
jgi:hypothetical protein